MPLDQEQLERGLAIFADLVEADPTASSALYESRREFFRGPMPAPGTFADDPRGELAVRRHLEWFLFERLGESGGQLAVDALLPAWRKAVEEEDLAGCEAAFLESTAGIYEVEEVVPGEGLVLRDLCAFARHSAAEPAAGELLEPGDLIAGRLFPLGDGLHCLSIAAAFFRDPSLTEALERDLEQLRESSGVRILHLAQIELEQMFWGRASGRQDLADPDVLPRARAFLRAGGLEDGEIEAVFEGLSAVPFDPAQAVPGAGDVLGGILDQLAFHTAVDLDRARKLLFAVCARLAQARPGGTDEPAEPAADARAAMAEFDAERAEGLDLEESFKRLEQRLGLEEEAGSDGEESPAPDFPGVVAAMVEEFLWEKSLGGGRAEEDYAGLRHFGRFARGVGVFENLSARDLLAYSCWWLPEEGGLESAEACARQTRALAEFCHWAEQQHQVKLHTTFGEQLAKIEADLPRAVESNLKLEEPEPAEAGGVYFEVRDLAADGRLELLGLEGEEVELRSPELAPSLAPGDWVRCRRRDDSGWRVLRCYPPQAGDLLRDLSAQRGREA